MTISEKTRVLELRRAGKGYRVIAQETGIAASTIADYCRIHRNDSLDLCPQCGANLLHIPKHRKKRFCSDKCRMLWWNAHPERINRRAYYHLVCKYCGKEFVSYGNDHRVFCSRQCASDFRKQEKR